jgi:hypothetical protein
MTEIAKKTCNQDQDGCRRQGSWNFHRPFQSEWVVYIRDAVRKQREL